MAKKAAAIAAAPVPVAPIAAVAPVALIAGKRRRGEDSIAADAAVGRREGGKGVGSACVRSKQGLNPRY